MPDTLSGPSAAHPPDARSSGQDPPAQDPPAQNQPDGLLQPQRGLAFLAVGIAMTMAVLDGAIVNVALPPIARDLGIAPAEAVWVLNAYQIAVTVALLPLSALGDILGYRRVYWAGLLVFTLASGLCSLAQTLPALVAARVLQGFGAAGIMSVNIALVRFIYPRGLIGQGVGNAALIVGVSSAAGPSVAAAILSVAPWQWLFLVNLPLGCLALVVAARTLPSNPLSGHRLDIWSAVLNALTFGALIVGVDRLGAPGGAVQGGVVLAGAALFGWVFARRQLALNQPMLPVDLLRRPVFALSVATSVCSFAAQMLAYVSLPFYFQNVLGRSEAQTGLLMTPWPLATALMSPIAGRLADRISPGRLGGAGLAILALGFALLAMMPEHPGTLDVVVRLAVCGFGFGLFQSPNNKALITSAPPNRSGGASGMQSTARLVGQSLGAAAVAVIFSLAPAHQLGLALWLATGLAAAGAVSSSLRRFEPQGGRGPARPAAGP